MSTNHTIEVERRLGAPRGIPTEWEIRSKDFDVKKLLRELLRELPELPGVSWSATAGKSTWSVIDLPQGVDVGLVGFLVVELAILDRKRVEKALRAISEEWVESQRPDPPPAPALSPALEWHPTPDGWTAEHPPTGARCTISSVDFRWRVCRTDLGLLGIRGTADTFETAQLKVCRIVAQMELEEGPT